MKNLLILLLAVIPGMSQALPPQPVAYKGTCFYSVDAAYVAFLNDWPQLSNGITYSLQTSTLTGQAVSYDVIDHNQAVLNDLHLSFSNCDTSSFSAYAVQDFLFPAMLSFALFIGFGHGYKFTGSA